MMLRVLAVSSAIALTGAGAAVATPTAKRTKTATISVKDDFFSPKAKTVSKGTKLKFVWKGKDLHNVVASGAATAHSKYQKSGSFSFTASKKGTINLVCQIHSDMKATITVK